MKAYSTLDDLSPTRRVLFGIAMASMGLVAVWVVHAHPEGLHAPAWVAFAACSCFVIAGIAVALHPFVSRQAYAWSMTGLLALMTVIPGWVAFGPGERHCTSTVSLLAGELGCRIVFGTSAIIMAGVTLIAAVFACKGKSAS